MGGVELDRSRSGAFVPTAGTGVSLNTAAGRIVDLLTRAELGTCPVSLESMRRSDPTSACISWDTRSSFATATGRRTPAPAIAAEFVSVSTGCVPSKVRAPG